MKKKKLRNMIEQVVEQKIGDTLDTASHPDFQILFTTPNIKERRSARSETESDMRWIEPPVNPNFDWRASP